MKAHLIKSADSVTLPVVKSLLTEPENGVWVSAPYDRKSLRLMVEQSTILRQAIDAYAHKHRRVRLLARIRRRDVERYREGSGMEQVCRKRSTGWGSTNH